MQDLVSVSACPLCGKECRELVSREQLSIEADVRDRILSKELPPGAAPQMLDDLTAFTNSYQARLVVCQHCGLVCRDPHFSSKGSIAAYSRDDYAPEWLESTFQEYYQTFSRRMPEFQQIVGQNATILEVGSYVGGFLAAARDAGWHVKGVDVGHVVSGFSRAKGLNVETKALREARLAEESFDAVFIWVCFDQLPDPRRELAEIYRLLRDNGHLFIQVPNGEFVKAAARVRRLVPSKTWREIIYDALAFTGLAGFPYQFGYTPHSIAQVLTDAGFGEIHVRNRLDLCSLGGPGNASTHKARTLQRVEKVMSIVHSLTLKKAEIGPWIEVVCRKE